MSCWMLHARCLALVGLLTLGAPVAGLHADDESHSPHDPRESNVAPISYDVYDPHAEEDCVPWWCADDNPFYGTVSLSQDAFFGFYTELSAGFAVTDRVDFTFYSILWTTPDFSFIGGGQGLWTEIGVGLNWNLLDGDLTVNPQFGVLNGTLLSGAARPLAFEGVVPNITVNYDGTFTEAEFYMGYYVATRAPRDNDFLHWWIYTGVKPWGANNDWRQIISTGVHFEQLRLTRSNNADPTDIYLWLGPYVQFALPNNLSLWFGGGWDVSSPENADFYKASISYSF